MRAPRRASAGIRATSRPFAIPSVDAAGIVGTRAKIVVPRFCRCVSKREWERNGGANWDRPYAEMASAISGYVRRGTPLGSSQLAEIESIVRSLVKRSGARNDRLAELAVAWVLLNPQPMALEKPDYGR